MSRDLTASAETASLAGHVVPVILVDLDLTSGFARFNTGDRTITYSGNDYLAVGNLGKISPFGEPSDLSAEGMTIELSGIPSTYINVALNEDIQGRAARIFLGFLNVTTYALIADPVLVFRGRLDTMDVQIGETATVQARVESRFADWDRPRIRRYTNQDQIARFIGDKGCEFVSQTTDRELVWGRA